MCRDQNGSVTVLGALIVCLLVSASVAVGHFAALLVERARTASAADMAALAGASVLTLATDPCAAAERIAAANGAVLERCEVSGEELGVEVSRRVAAGPGQGRALRARARARLVISPAPVEL